MNPFVEAAANSGPSWVTVLSAVGLGTVLSSLVTASSLIYQNRKTSERDDRRRVDETERQKQERAHNAAQATLEREHQRQMLVDSHLSELSRQREADRRSRDLELLRDKLDAYGSFLTLVTKAEHQIERRTSYGWRQAGQPLPKIQVLSEADLFEIQIAGARVALLSPSMVDPKHIGTIENSVNVVSECLNTIAVAYEIGTVPPSTTDFIRDVFKGFNRGREQYMQAVRVDLADLLGKDPAAPRPT
jgi:hypothetical protein